MREDSTPLFGTSTTLHRTEPTPRVNAITSTSLPPYVQNHTTGAVIGVSRIAGKIIKSKVGEVINPPAEEEEVDCDLSHCVLAGFHFSSFPQTCLSVSSADDSCQ